MNQKNATASLASQPPFAYAAVVGPRPLSLVHVPLLAYVGEAQEHLKTFMDFPTNVNVLLRTEERLEHIRGILAMIELAGAELLVQEMIMQIAALGESFKPNSPRQLPAIANALCVLERYLSGLDLERAPLHEVLLPTINQLRVLAGRRDLSESFFFSARLQEPRPGSESSALDALQANALARRLRQGYQVGLLDFMRDLNGTKPLKLMGMALERLDQLYAKGARSQLCWVGAAAIEAMLQGQLVPRKARKSLFSRLDRELKHLLERPGYRVPDDLHTELLYLVALADSQGFRVREVRSAFALQTLPFTDHYLEKQALRLASPDAEALAPLAQELNADLVRVQGMLDQLARGGAGKDRLLTIQTLLRHVGETLNLAGLNNAAQTLRNQLAVLSRWGSSEELSEPSTLQALAEALLFVEGEVASLTPVLSRDSSSAEEDAGSFARHQLAEARVVLVDEAQLGFAAARRAITACLESEANVQNLSRIAANLHTVRGGLLFLDQQRAAALTGACADYIKNQMLDLSPLPEVAMLEALADVLSRLEVYLENGAVLHSGPAAAQALDEACVSLRSLGLRVAA